MVNPLVYVIYREVERRRHQWDIETLKPWDEKFNWTNIACISRIRPFRATKWPIKVTVNQGMISYELVRLTLLNRMGVEK